MTKEVDPPDGLIERIIEYSATNRTFVFFVFALLVSGGIWAMRNTPLDAIPDLSDTQVVVYVQWMGRDPQLVEDQVTYPIVSSLLAAPGVRVVRGFSDFSMAYVYVIFEDGTDLYWARSRVLEYMSSLQGRLPDDAEVSLGPDATGVGWVFQYALVDRSGRNNLAELRSLQDWNLRYALSSVEGVAEVAPIGGFVRTYQVEVDPNALVSRGLSLHDVMARIRDSNRDVGGRVVEMAGLEYIVRGRGYIEKEEDLAGISLGASPDGTPVRLGDVAHVALGPDLRRGVAELDGKGEVVGGVVVIRHGENALDVIDRVKERIEEMKPSLPEGVEIVTVYDRSDLILRSIDTLKESLTEEMIIVALVILIFLWHPPSSLVPILTIPIAVVLSFLPMWYFGVTTNILSMGGIAVAIADLVDAAIVVVENTHKRLEEWEAAGHVGASGLPETETSVILRALKEVGRPAFFSLLVIAVSFLPVFALTGQEGRLFRPLALTKNLSMAIGAILAITLAPALIRMLVSRRIPYFGRPRREDENPASRLLIRIYEPACRFVLEWPWTVLALALGIVLVSLPLYLRLGSEFMPPLWEGSFLYMPSSPRPGASAATAGDAIRVQDALIAAHPAVATVFGKVGRAVSATDPAPLSMVETTITLKDEVEWPRVHQARWWSGRAPRLFAAALAKIWPEERAQTWREVRSELDASVRIPGWPSIWTMPIENRTNMLSTGIRAPVGIKIFGDDLATIDSVAQTIAEVVRRVPGTTAVVLEPILGQPYISILPRRDEIARYGLTVDDVNRVVESAIGGMTLTTTVEGRERYPVQVRYPRELRSDPARLARVLVPTMAGAQIPLGDLAEIRIEEGPAMIRDEDGRLAGYLNVDYEGRDLGTYVERAKEAVAREVTAKGLLPVGYRIGWSGQYEFQIRAKERLLLLVPITLGLVIILLYLNTGSMTKTTIVLLAVPFSAVGAIWFLYLLDYNISVAVWVGLIALLGVDAETGAFMLLFLDLSHDKARAAGRLRTIHDLKEAIVDGAVKRIRPKFMTVATNFIGLAPIMWATGTGSDMMKRIAAPMIGGIGTSFVMELLVYPAIYLLWKRRTL